MKRTCPIIHSIVILLLGLALLAPAQELPQDLTAISPAQALVLQDLGRLYKFSSYVPGYPPLPPGILAGAVEDGSANATNLFYSASLAAIFWDERETVTWEALQTALGGNWQMYQEEEEEEEYEMPPLDTSGLYLEITNVADGLAFFNLRNGTNQVYAIWSTSDLAAGWNVVAEVWPTNAEVMPFTLPTCEQTNLFVLAQDWTGVTENGNTTPDWWLWKYFGTVALSDTNLDSQGANTLVYDYTNNLDPNVLTFTLSTTNHYVNQATAVMQVNLLTGIPSYYAVMLNDTNTAAATWLSYPGTNLNVGLGSTDGTYMVRIGLRGRPLDATQSWQSLTVIRDTTPLTLGLTNLSSLSGSRPFIDPAGYASRALSALNWTLIDATGATNTGNGTVVAQDWNLSDPWHATNWLQCVDLPLALGTNWISIQATDWAGSIAETNFSYVFDTNGDTNAPALTVAWPPAEGLVSGESFTVQASTDDDTAAVALQYLDGNGIVQTVNGVVERGGKVWVRDVPLAAGTNQVSVLTTDAAGNVSTNNLAVLRTNLVFEIASLTQDELKYAYAAVWVTGDDWDATVTVNGVLATNLGCGYWEAGDVPLPLGGIVTLQATAQLASGATVHTVLTQERGPIVFTQTYEYKLDYSFDGGSSNTWESHHFEMHWARGVGGTNLETSWRLNGDGSVSSNYYVAVWPPENGYWPSLHAQTWSASYLNGVLTDSLAWTADRPSVEWMEKSSSAGSRADLENVSWSEASGREVRLFTGGQAERQDQGLLDLSASLNIESVLDPQVYAWAERYRSPEFTSFLATESPPVGVPPQEVALGTVGMLGSDGHRYTVQASGNELVITPIARATSYSGDLPSVTRHKLVIRANTNDLSLTTPQFCVGQLVNLQAAWSPSLLGGTQTSYYWVYSLDFVNTKIPGNGDSSDQYVIDPTKYTNNPTPLWWYSGGGKIVWCHTTNVFPNGQVIAFTPMGADVSVYRPEISDFIDHPPSFATNCVDNDTLYLQLGDNNSHGDMNYEVHVWSYYGGTAGIVQLIKRSASNGSVDSGSLGTDGAFWLDSSYPYITSPVLAYEDTPVTFSDGPGVPDVASVLSWTTSVSDQFIDYVVFRPSAGVQADNIYVTLGVVSGGNPSWGWSASTTWTLGWSTPTYSITRPTWPDDSNGFPTWLYTWHP